MSTLILVTIFGLGFAFFATQNTGAVNISFGNSGLFSIPIYLVVLGSLLIGLVLSWVINTIDWIGSTWTIRDRESKIKDIAGNNLVLQKQIHDLELENARLRGEKREVEVKQEYAHPNWLDRLRHNLAT